MSLWSIDRPPIADLLLTFVGLIVQCHRGFDLGGRSAAPRPRRGNLRGGPVEFEAETIFKFEIVLVRLTGRGRRGLDLGWAD